MKKKLLLFATHQFGYLTDTAEYCRYAKDQYDITYIGWDYGKMEVTIQGIHVRYISREGNLLQRNYRLLRALCREVRSGGYDVVFTHYTRGISLVKLLNLKQPFVFDIRTGSTDRNPLRRKAYNFFMKLESLVFRHVTVISDGLAAQLGIRRYALLPLGADAIETPAKQFSGDYLYLLYVGTLQNRNVLTCVQGLHKYLLAHPADAVMLTIVGDSPGTELQEIKQYVHEHTILNGKVICTGRIPHDELGNYFREAHAGVSFIPVTRWYSCQQPTKTYEYLLSGLPVIATRTQEHEKLLAKEEMCVLINDTADDFAKAIADIRLKIPHVNAEALRQRYIVWSWENVIRHYFIPVIQQIL